MMTAACSVTGCDRDSKTRGMCGMHAERVRRYGRTDLLPRPSIDERFWSKVNKTETCWLWTAQCDPAGYGHFAVRVDGRRTNPGAHQWAYLRLVGPVPEGLELDHLCRVRNCVNPAHLEPVTHRENALRGLGPHILLHHANRCKRGHELTPENTISRPSGRRCRTCEMALRRARTEREGRQRKSRLAARGPLLRTSVPAKAVRAWARNAGLVVPSSGPLSQGVVAAYLEVHPEHDAASGSERAA